MFFCVFFSLSLSLLCFLWCVVGEGCERVSDVGCGMWDVGCDVGLVGRVDALSVVRVGWCNDTVFYTFDVFCNDGVSQAQGFPRGSIVRDDFHVIWQSSITYLLPMYAVSHGKRIWAHPATTM